MKSGEAVLARLWPVVLQAERVTLRPVTPQDAPAVRAVLSDPEVRAFLGGPVSEAGIEARQRDYPTTPGMWAVAPAAGGEVIGLVSITADSRFAGRAEISYQLLSSAWGQGLGREAVGAVVDWWAAEVPNGGPLIVVTQERNTASRRLLEAVGMTVLDTLLEYGEQQCLYTPGSEETALRWARLLQARTDEVERRRGAEERATAAGRALPENLSALTPEQMQELCPARHGAYGRICAREIGHAADLHLGRSADGAWIAWLATAAPAPVP
ncbi:GNAT family N-acetyltransferase [Streptomyces sp. OfavH-34-F]|uniref:GNAT family N-acetyltransferase n=1 Tax=Streptomyces sp. OfavH-34-F TaxID=2917760 RepID=UPI001EF30646|nr:GNAT family N-acetyltransferase [Streptomyces sp. OfavH-34-F]MCG7523985.1 GNAT family N-acetyltransferase [Streptomyces sp. OfavH-34-F]